MTELGIAFVFYALIAIVTLLIGWLKSRMQYWRRLGVAQAEPSFIVGNLKGLGETRHLFDIFRETYDQFKGTGPFCGFYFLINPAAFILDLELAKNILIRDFNNFDERGVFFNERDDPLTGHLFNLDAPEWRKLRSKLSPTFSSGKMKQMFPSIVQIGEECSRVFAESLHEQNGGGEIEIKDLFARFTTDVIGTCIFGLDCNSLKDPDVEFRVMSKHMFKVFRHSKLVHAFMHSFPKLARRLRMREMHDLTNEFFFRIVRETVDHRERNGIKRNDLMNMLIEMKNSKDENQHLNMTEITANAFIFFVAGFETSSTTMTFALYELAQNETIQTKLRAEIVEVLAKHDGELTYECMQEMHYLNQVIMETLRKYSILPQLQRQARADYPTNQPGFTIRKGTLVIIPIDAIHHDPEIFPEPEKFDPERFSPEEIQNRHAMSWLAFGDGPRNCIGMRFGQMQTRVGLVSVLKNYKFSVCKRTTLPMEYDLMLPLLSPKDGVYLHAEKL